MRVAIPTNNPGGIKAERSDHFGHCDIFTILDLTDDFTIENVETIENGGHDAGGCLIPVKTLSDAKVEAIVVGGMGARPMQGFVQAGIKVYFANIAMITTAEEVAKGFAENMLPLMNADQVCQGSGNCQH